MQKDENLYKNETNEELSKTSNIFVEPVQNSVVKSNLSIIDEVNDEEKLFSDFGLRIETPVIYNSKNPIPLNEVLPQGIVYMIQLGVFSSEKNPEVFNGLTPLSCLKNNNSTNRKYFAGKFQILSVAEKNLPLVKNKGFKDAFVIAFNNNKPISIKEAFQLESKKNNSIQEEVNKTSTDNSKKENDLSIIYVLKGQINANDSMLVINSKDSLPDNIELYIRKSEGASFFIVKSFATYDEAVAVRTKLKGLVKNEIEIHAYFAENQIPLEQARKITK